MTNWKPFEKTWTGPNIVKYPAVSFGKTLLYFNRLAASMIGLDMKKVIIMLDEKSKSIGFWFFRNNIKTPPGMKHSVYTVLIKNTDVLNISIRSLIRSTHWLKRKVDAYHDKMIPIVRDSSEGKMDDFYVLKFDE